LPLPPALARAFRDLPDPLALAGLGVGTPEKLARAAGAHPEGWLHLTRGALLGRRDTPAGWAEAEGAFLQAAGSPSVFPVRRAAPAERLRDRPAAPRGEKGD